MELARTSRLLSNGRRRTHAVVEHGFGAQRNHPFAIASLREGNDFKTILSKHTHRVHILSGFIRIYRDGSGSKLALKYDSDWQRK